MGVASDFKSSLRKFLSEREEISSRVAKFYIAPAKGVKYPFLLIGLDELKNNSNPFLRSYETKFRLEVFSRDKKDDLSFLADALIKAMDSKKPEIADYTTIGINLDKVFFELGEDLVTNKLTLTYKALLRKEI